MGALHIHDGFEPYFAGRERFVPIKPSPAKPAGFTEIASQPKTPQPQEKPHAALNRGVTPTTRR